jgi:WD domain, G-beta repeat
MHLLLSTLSANLRFLSAKGVAAGHFSRFQAGREPAVAFSPGGKLVLTGSLDSTARLWQVADGKLVATLSGHGGPVIAVAFSPDGKLVLTGSDDKTVRLWQAPDGKSVATLSAGGAGGVLARRQAGADRLRRQHGTAVAGGGRQACGDAVGPRQAGRQWWACRPARRAALSSLTWMSKAASTVMRLCVPRHCQPTRRNPKHRAVVRTCITKRIVM